MWRALASVVSKFDDRCCCCWDTGACHANLTPANGYSAMTLMMSAVPGSLLDVDMKVYEVKMLFFSTLFITNNDCQAIRSRVTLA